MRKPPAPSSVISSDVAAVTSTMRSGVATPSLRWSTRFVPPPRNTAAGSAATLRTAVEASPGA
jgi:hypothetical protein